MPVRDSRTGFFITRLDGYCSEINSYGFVTCGKQNPIDKRAYR